MIPILIAPFTEEVLSLYGGVRYAGKTYKKMRQVLGEFQAIEGVATTADFTTANVARYVASLGEDANPNTTNGKLDYLRTAWNYAIEVGYLDRPPILKRIRPRARKGKLNTPLTYEQAAKLLSHLQAKAADWEGRRLYTLYALILLTGIRRNEALYARVEDLDLSGRILQIEERTERLKTFESDRPVPLPEALVPVLEQWLSMVGSKDWLFPGVKLLGPWTGGMPGRKAIDHLKREAEAVGISKITWHGLRHTFGSHALMHHDVPLWVVQAVMGHTDVRTTQRYLHVGRPAILAESVRAIHYAKPAQLIA